MNMLGHDDISQNHEAIAAAHSFKDLQEEVTAGLATEKWLTPVTTERDKVEVSLTVVAL